MPEITDGLRDIHGLDITSVDIWLAIGWRSALAMAGLVAAFWLGRRIVRRWRAYRRAAWEQTALRALDYLAQQQGKAPAKDMLDALTELLRRIVIATHGRRHVAALTGEEWLRWLARHDPQGFDWAAQGHALITAAYAPAAAQHPETLGPILAAARIWVRHYAAHPSA